MCYLYLIGTVIFYQYITLYQELSITNCLQIKNLQQPYMCFSVFILEFSFEIFLEQTRPLKLSVTCEAVFSIQCGGTAFQVPALFALILMLPISTERVKTFLFVSPFSPLIYCFQVVILDSLENIVISQFLRVY